MYVEGFKYWLAYKKGNTQYFRCRRYKSNCAGRCVVEDGQIRTTNPHSHSPEPDRALVERFRRVLTQRAQKERTELYTIYWEEATQRHSDAAMIYSFTQAESCMRKARRKQPPQSCTTIRELSEILTNSSLFFITCGADKENLYKTTLIHDDGTCLIFMHYKTLEKIGRVDEMHVGMLKSEPAPPNFNYSILTIHAVEQKQSYPFMYVVITMKSQAFYSAIFSNLRENFPNVAPSNIFSNYDTDLMEALKEVFPEATIRGFYVTYTSAVLNKMKLLKISKQKSHVTSAVRMLLVLPLLPANYMRTGLQSIRKWLQEKKAMTPQFEYLAEYVEQQWLIRLGADKMSIFSLPHCVTNHIQTFNSEIQAYLGISNPIIWHMLEAITHIARQTFTKLTKRSKQLPASMNKTPKKGQILQNTIITSATQQWIRTPVHLRNSLQFLQVTSHCINDALFVGSETSSTNSSQPTSTIQTELPSLTYTIQTMNSVQTLTNDTISSSSSSTASSVAPALTTNSNLTSTNPNPSSPPPLMPNTTQFLTPVTTFQSVPVSATTATSTTSEYFLQPAQTTTFAMSSSEPPPLIYYRNIKCSEPPPLIYYKDMTNSNFS